MIEINDKSHCTGCTACASICPVQCIRMRPDEEGFQYPVYSGSGCIECGLCIQVCPIKKEKTETSGKVQAYAGINKEEGIRRKSSSGGVFTVGAGDFKRKWKNLWRRF